MRTLVCLAPAQVRDPEPVWRVAGGVDDPAAPPRGHGPRLHHDSAAVVAAPGPPGDPSPHDLGLLLLPPGQLAPGERGGDPGHAAGPLRRTGRRGLRRPGSRAGGGPGSARGEEEALDDLLAEHSAIQPGPRLRPGYTNGRHRTTAMLDAGVRRTAIVRWLVLLASN